MTVYPAAKNDLRREARARRGAMTAQESAAAAEAFTRVFLENVALPAGAVVAGYRPHRRELDVRPLLRALAARGHAVALPCVVGDARPLVFRKWEEGMELVKGPFGIEQPAKGAQVAPAVVIVPLLGFDARGHRLGYGAGFYDRTLAAGGAVKIGAGYEWQKLEEVPAGPYDVAMDMIVTDKRVHACERREA